MNPIDVAVLALFLAIAAIFFSQLWIFLRGRDRATREAEPEIRRRVLASMEQDFLDGLDPEDWEMEYEDRLIEEADRWWREGFPGDDSKSC